MIKPFKLQWQKVYVTSFIITNSFGCIITCCNGGNTIEEKSMQLLLLCSHSSRALDFR